MWPQFDGMDMEDLLFHQDGATCHISVGVCMCAFCTVWMCEAYVKMWVGIWWVLLWCVCIVMCGGVYVWVLYCMDV